MHQGQLLAEGTPGEISRNQVVQSAYLGGLYDLSGSMGRGWRGRETGHNRRGGEGGMMDNELEVRDIHTFIGQFHILQGVSLEVPRGSIIALLGRNGAGKTTTLKSILGLTPPRQGKVLLAGREIQGRRSFDIAALGIGFVPEHRAIFRDLSRAREPADRRAQEGRP